jgi:hypothetical protein
MDSPVIVIDIPISVSAEEAARILSEPVTRGYYMRAATAGDPMRVVFVPYAADKCDEELRAIDVAVARKRETATRIVQVLCKIGIFRSTTWVKKTLDDMS